MRVYTCNYVCVFVPSDHCTSTCTLGHNYTVIIYNCYITHVYYISYSNTVCISYMYCYYNINPSHSNSLIQSDIASPLSCDISNFVLPIDVQNLCLQQLFCQWTKNIFTYYSGGSIQLRCFTRHITIVVSMKYHLDIPVNYLKFLIQFLLKYFKMTEKFLCHKI